VYHAPKKCCITTRSLVLRVCMYICVFEGRLMRDCFTVIIQNRLAGYILRPEWVCVYWLGARRASLLAAAFDAHGGEKWKRIHLICICASCVQSGKIFFLFMSSLPHFTVEAGVFDWKENPVKFGETAMNQMPSSWRNSIYKAPLFFSLIQIEVHPHLN
jgi:hypothetical protein